MKIREVLMLKKHDLNDGCERLNGCRFNSVSLDQIRPSNLSVAGNRWPRTAAPLPPMTAPKLLPSGR
jgi:hypothetical protein